MHARHLIRHRTMAICVTATAALLLSAACAPSAPAGSSGSAASQSASSASGGSSSSGGSASADSASASSSVSGAGSESASGSASGAGSASGSFDLDALIAAAKKEGSVTVYDSTGKITDVAKNFEKKYGIKATGVKIKSDESVTKLTKEVAAGNVTVDVATFDDGPVVGAKLLPQHIVDNWVPPDFADSIPKKFQNPLALTIDPEVFSYNTKAFPNGCPIDNIWDITKPEWKGKFGIEDPVVKSKYVDMFSSFSLAATDALTKAYQDEFGSAPPKDEKDIAWELAKRVFENDPVLTTSQGDLSAAVDASTADKPMVAFYSIAKFRDNEAKGYHLGVCDNVEPFIGVYSPKYIFMVHGAPHPNAAKLLIHYMFTEEGIAPESVDAKQSTNKDVPLNPDAPVDMSKYTDEMFVVNPANIEKVWNMRQSMKDFIRTHKH